MTCNRQNWNGANDDEQTKFAQIFHLTMIDNYRGNVNPPNLQEPLE